MQTNALNLDRPANERTQSNRTRSPDPDITQIPDHHLCQSGCTNLWLTQDRCPDQIRKRWRNDHYGSTGSHDPGQRGVIYDPKLIQLFRCGTVKSILLFYLDTVKSWNCWPYVMVDRMTGSYCSTSSVMYGDCLETVSVIVAIGKISHTWNGLSALLLSNRASNSIIFQVLTQKDMFLRVPSESSKYKVLLTFYRITKPDVHYVYSLLTMMVYCRHFLIHYLDMIMLFGF